MWVPVFDPQPNYDRPNQQPHRRCGRERERENQQNNGVRRVLRRGAETEQFVAAMILGFELAHLKARVSRHVSPLVSGVEIYKPQLADM